MGTNTRLPDPAISETPDDAAPDDGAEGHQQASGPTPDRAPATDTNKPPFDQQNQATVEDLGREGLGFAAKE